MEKITTFEQLVAHLASLPQRSRVAVVWAADPSTQGAVWKAIEKGVIEAIFFGATEELAKCPETRKWEQYITMVDAADPDDAAAKAVSMVREGQADVLMKGMINTDNLLRAVLNKEQGILPRGNVLTHVTVAEIPSLDRLLVFTDAAVIPYPTQQQREEQVRYATAICRSLGVAEPKVALIHCTEKPNGKHFPFTEGYAEIIEKAKAGEFGPCVVDGPLDLKTSLDRHALEKKGLDSPLQGESDVIIFPDIESGNVFYKAITLFAQANTAGMLQGTMAPVVLASRGDSIESKFCSLAAAAILVNEK